MAVATLYDLVSGVLNRLGDLEAKVWTRDEIALYVQDAYDLFCRRTRALFDIAVVENVPPTGNYTTDLERYHAEQHPGWGVTDSPLHYTDANIPSRERAHGASPGVGGSYSGPAGQTDANDLSQIPDGYTNSGPWIPRPEALYAYWSLDETSGNSRVVTLGSGIGAADLAETGGAVGSATGQFSLASDSHKGDAKGLLADISGADLTTVGFTVALWCYPYADFAIIPAALFTIWDGAGVYVGGASHFTLHRFYNSDYLDMQLGITGGTTLLPVGQKAGPLYPDAWNVIVVTVDAVAKTVRLEINGGATSDPATVNWTKTLSFTGSLGNLSPDTFNVGHPWGAIDAWHGRVDAAMLWTVPLTVAEARYIYDGTEPAGTDGVARTQIPTQVTGGPLPQSTVEVERVAWNRRTLVGMGTEQMRQLDPTYELRSGDPQFYTWDKDGLLTLRVIPAAAGDAVYPVTSGAWGTRTYTTDTDVTPDFRDYNGRTTGGFGILRAQTDTFNANGEWGTPTRIHPTDTNITVDTARLGRSLTTNPSELPAAYNKYVVYWAMSRALRHDGPGQDLDLADHYEQRFELGVKRMNERRADMQPERVRRLAGGGDMVDGGFGIGLPVFPYPYGLPEWPNR